MSKTLLIIQREFLTRVKKKSFILLTILMPFIMVALVAVPIWLASSQSKTTNRKQWLFPTLPDAMRLDSRTMPLTVLCR